MSTEQLPEHWTDRDRAWNAALDVAHQYDRFTVDDVLDSGALPESKRRTVRRVLQVMEATSWAEHTKGSRYWRPGPKIYNNLYYG